MDEGKKKHKSVKISVCPGCMEEYSGEDSCLHCGYDPETDEVASHHLPIGTILHGTYYVGKALGEGGFGITYLGYDLNLHLKVAIKEYYPKELSSRYSIYGTQVTVPTGKSLEDFQEGKEKFLDEAQRLAKFQALPGIVTVYAFFQENGTAYIVMEYVEGQTLGRLLEKCGGKIEVKELLALMKPVIESLEKIHGDKEEGGIIHRDISPDNLMIDQYGQIKLLDFGAAREYAAGGAYTLSIILKRKFAPVEQYTTKSKQGPWTDVYALCATMYYCITGILPPESMERILEDDMRLPSELGILIPENIEQALKKGLEIRSQDRYQDMKELAEDLYALPEKQESIQKARLICPGCMEEYSGENPCPHCGYDLGTHEVASHHLPIGTILHGKYYVGRVLGEGGSGITYLGYDFNSLLKVAIKEYFPKGLITRSNAHGNEISIQFEIYARNFQAEKERFMEEAKRLQNSDHCQKLLRYMTAFRKIERFISSWNMWKGRLWNSC